MSAAPLLVTLAEESIANYVLGGALLPLNNNESYIRESTARTVTMVDENERAIACAAVMRCSNYQAYCVIAEVDEKFRNYTIWIEEAASSNEESRVYRITKSVPYIVHRTAPTLFELVFLDDDGRPTGAHLADAIIDCSVGKLNFNLYKNVTIDLFEGSGTTENHMVFWRDITGFIVFDNHHFQNVIVARNYLLSLADDADDAGVQTIDRDNLQPILDYDLKLSTYNRVNHLTTLFHIPGVAGKVARRQDNGQNNVCGYILTYKDRVLACYAESERDFRKLISSVAVEMSCHHCKMFVMGDAFEITQEIIKNSTKTKAVVRLHTRSLNEGVKWNKIYCPNIGLNVF